MTILFVNACVRKEQSRTLMLCREYLTGMHPIEEVDLTALTIKPFTAEMVAYRMQLQRNGVFDDPIFDLAKQFASVDEIVIGAPYWDLSFPSILKVYIEHVSVCDITFAYTDDARCVGKCKAKNITFICTCGGNVAGANYGYEYISGIATMFGIPEVRFVVAEGLDIVGADVKACLDRARVQIAKLKQYK